MVTVTISNRGHYVETVTYNSVFGSRSLHVDGGDSLTVTNATSSTNPEAPDNILNLPPDNGVVDIVLSDFRYNKTNISIQITSS